MSSAKSHYGEFLKALGFHGDEEFEGLPNVWQSSTGSLLPKVTSNRRLFGDETS